MAAKRQATWRRQQRGVCLWLRRQTTTTRTTTRTTTKARSWLEHAPRKAASMVSTTTTPSTTAAKRLPSSHSSIATSRARRPAAARRARKPLGRALCCSQASASRLASITASGANLCAARFLALRGRSCLASTSLAQRCSPRLSKRLARACLSSTRATGCATAQGSRSGVGRRARRESTAARRSRWPRPTRHQRHCNGALRHLPSGFFSWCSVRRWGRWRRWRGARGAAASASSTGLTSWSGCPGLPLS
mmetsp:Transcript_10321/g.23896  ORF Transcript_10321/g.23896 Transcript_10321/m.23896 type:complete len:249 (+) Transcript_10321:207-953(+)